VAATPCRVTSIIWRRSSKRGRGALSGTRFVFSSSRFLSAIISLSGTPPPQGFCQWAVSAFNCFLGLRDRYLEKDLEDAILRELEQFLLELGAGFSFIARQKRIQVDNDDYYLDLLFFNRKLRRLVAVELKLGDFKPVDKGQMELYLRWLDKYERQDDENPPIGLVLCAGKKRETVELLELEKSSIRVAEYLTELPPRDVLIGKLHKALDHARKQFQSQIERSAGE
jgi:hypothetical protein